MPKPGSQPANRAMIMMTPTLTVSFPTSHRFDLHQPVRVDKAHHLHDGVGGPDATKELAVDCRHLFPVLYPVNKILVRVTSESLPPNSSMADWMISRHLRA